MTTTHLNFGLASSSVKKWNKSMNTHTCTHTHILFKMKLTEVGRGINYFIIFISTNNGLGVHDLPVGGVQVKKKKMAICTIFSWDFPTEYRHAKKHFLLKYIYIYMYIIFT